PGSPTANLVSTASVVEGLCCSRGAMTEQRKAVCRAVAGELERTIRRWDTEKEALSWSSKGRGREGGIESLTRALSAIGAGDLLGEFLAHALADKAHYGLHAVLIPAVRTMYGWTTKDPVVVECRQRVLHHCITELERLTEKPVAEPTDWVQDIT